MDRLAVIYDGYCPFCSRYIGLLRLRAAFGCVDLIDARKGGPLIEDVSRRGLDVDAGMILIIGDVAYHGAECIHRLALMSTPSGLFNRINVWIFRSGARSRLIYPILRSGRDLTLRLLGRSLLTRV